MQKKDAISILVLLLGMAMVLLASTLEFSQKEPELKLVNINYSFSDGFLIVSGVMRDAEEVEICLKDAGQHSPAMMLVVTSICIFKYNVTGNFSERIIPEGSLRKMNDPCLTVTIRQGKRAISQNMAISHDRFFYPWRQIQKLICTIGKRFYSGDNFLRQAAFQKNGNFAGAKRFYFV